MRVFAPFVFIRDPTYTTDGSRVHDVLFHPLGCLLACFFARTERFVSHLKLKAVAPRLVSEIIGAQCLSSDGKSKLDARTHAITSILFWGFRLVSSR